MTRCGCETQSGTRCKNPAQRGTGFCRLHQNCTEENTRDLLTWFQNLPVVNANHPMDELRRQEYEERQKYENSRRSGMLAAMEKRDKELEERQKYENDIRVQEIIVQGLAKEIERSAKEIERLNREIARIQQ